MAEENLDRRCGNAALQHPGGVAVAEDMRRDVADTGLETSLLQGLSDGVLGERIAGNLSCEEVLGMTVQGPDLAQMVVKGAGQRDETVLGTLAVDIEGKGAPVNRVGPQPGAFTDAQTAGVEGLATGLDDRNAQGGEQRQAFCVLTGVRERELTRGANLFLKRGQGRAKVFWKRKKSA